MTSFDVHLVTHTHWDREWYLPAGRFRQRLVALIDALLERSPGEGSVLLDGQTVLLDDYLDVRPERRAELSARLADGSLEAGPWYVLADELIPTGESLARNLLLGRRTLRRLGAQAPPVLYSPDAFGHPAALPTLAAGFALPVIILWRGLGGEAWPPGDTFRWRAPDGSEALVVHLPRAGYEFASSLPPEEAGAARWWRNARAELGARARTELLLLLNGADHHAPQHDLSDAVTALERVVAPDRLRRSSLSAYAREVVRACGDRALPVITGELRHSYGYTWTLQGTLASRAHLKRRHALVERVLLREAEPFTALAARSGSPGRGALVHAAWRTLLLCQPHDTLCGCSADEVARAMAARLEDAATQAHGLTDDALLDLVEHDRVAARAAGHRWQNCVLLCNPAPRSRGGVAELEIMRFVRHVPVGPGSAEAPAGTPARQPARDPCLDGGRVPLQVLQREERHHRVESPEHYPDDDLVEVIRAAAWIDGLAGYGVRLLPVGADSAPPAADPPAKVRGHARAIQNEHLRLELTGDGEARLTSLRDGRVMGALLRVEDVGDAGDLYTHSPVLPRLEGATAHDVRLVHAGPLRAELATSWRLDVPRRSRREGRSEETASLELRIDFVLDADARHLLLRVRGVNTACDHRLRLVIASAVEDGMVHADAAFGVVRRSRLAASAEAARMERPPGTAPLHRYVTVANDRHGLTVVSDGLAEYEATGAGEIAITLLRAVGELSRIDLPERPGNAGWPLATPEAQSLGSFESVLALFPHGARRETTIAAIERLADDVLAPLSGRAMRSALHIPAPFAGVELQGDGLAFSACKESEDGLWLVLRCINLLDREVHGAWTIGVPATRAMRARLDETPLPLEELPLEDRTVRFDAQPGAVVTILVR